MEISADILNLAIQKTPKVNVIHHNQLSRFDIANTLNGVNNIGLELGVASGLFSHRLLHSGKFDHVFGVDLYEDHHSVEEYKYALKLIGFSKKYTLLRMSFDDALELFDDSFFDFIYFDGYAHTGEEGGKTFIDWWQKLKVGGTYSGDDYDSDWPLVIWGVNALSIATGSQLNVSGKHNHYPSWFMTKNQASVLREPLDSDLLEVGLRLREASRYLVKPYEIPRLKEC